MNFYTFNYKGFEFKVRQWSKRQLELNCYQSGKLVWSANEFINSLDVCNKLVQQFLKKDNLCIGWVAKVVTERINNKNRMVH